MSASRDRSDEQRSSGVQSRIPQHDLEAEAAVLSAMMLDRGAVDAVIPVLRPEHFYSEANRRIYEVAQWLAEQNSPVIDVVTIAARLRDTERLAQAGGPSYLAQICDSTPAVAHVDAHAKLVVDKWRLRSLAAFCQTIAAEAYGHRGPAATLIEQAERGMYELSRADVTKSFVPIGEPVGATFDHLVDLAQRGVRMSGQSTGFYRLDSKTAGLHDGELTIVAARPGMGKTSLVLDMAQHIAGINIIQPQRGVAFFSLEMPKEQLATRMMCSRARVNVGKLRQGYIAPEEWDRLAMAANEIRPLPIYIDDSSGLSLSQLRSKLRRLIAEKRNEGVEIRVVIVDYLQLMNGIGSSREEQVASLSKGCKEVSKEFSMPVILLAQLNRAVETRGGKDKRPQLSDLRESGAVEQDADNVIFIYRESYYDQETEKQDLAELIVAKQRNGPTGRTLCRFLGAFTRFENLADGEEPDDEAA
jgi:replicative DNA helicase